MINPSETQGAGSIRRYKVVGSRRLSNYWWASTLLLGGLGFLLTGVSSYLTSDFLPLVNGKNILFFPQGLVMCFYGVLGLLFSCYLWLYLFWGVGDGFNEFNKKQGYVRLFRWGFPGRNRRIDLSYDMRSIEAITLEIKEGFNPRRILSIRFKGDTTLQGLEGSKAKDNAKDSSLNNISGERSFLKDLSLEKKRDIPLTRIGQLRALEDIEKQAAELARFLQVSLELKQT